MNPGARFPAEPGIFAYDNPKNQQSCPLNVCRAATNGANPAKSIQPKNRPNAKAAQFTHPVTGKSPRKVKRNRKSPDFPANSLSLPRLFTRIAQHGILTAAPGSPGAVFYRTCAHSYANRSRADQWHIAIIRFSSFCASISSHTDQPFEEYGNGFAFLNLRNDV